MLDRKQIKREYKEKKHPMGIYKVTNKVNGKIFIRKSKDINASANRFEFGKRINKCLENELKEDFEKYGADNFCFEIEVELKEKNDPDFDAAKELERLEEEVIAKYSPYAANGYNRRSIN